jgi:serine/threonine protein kinase/tetratricopeptide (TPR) repeat protein
VIDLLEHLETALVGRYALQREIARGAQATVYVARDVRHERLVALKVLRPELAALLGADGFVREIKLTAQLRHPHILPLYDSGEVNGALYYVTPYVTGESLRGRLAREGRLGIGQAVRIAREVGEALDYAHRQGIVHRDIKPDNILLDEDGHAIVADFGIARALERASDAAATGTGLALGTPAYMSPEQAMGERDLDGRSDIYSLGCVLYEMLAGNPPFSGSSVQATIAMRFAGPPASVRALRAEVTPQLARVVARSLATAPERRFGSARELSHALGDRESVPAIASHSQGRAISGMPVHPRRLVLLGVAGFMLVGAVLMRVYSHRSALSSVPLRVPAVQRAAASTPDPKRVSIADFENQTGDAALDPVGRMAADWIIHGLVQTGLVDVVDPRSAVRTAKGDSVRGDSRAAPGLQSMIDATRAGTVITGSYYRENDSLRFEAHINDSRTGKVVTTIESSKVPVTEPTRGIDPFRQRVIGSLATILDPHLREWSRTSAIAPTYPAYREFADGVDAYQRGDFVAAIAHLTRASTIDTSFHLAQLWSVQAYDNFVHGNLAVNASDAVDTAAMRPARDSLYAVLQAAREELGPLDRTLLDFLLALDHFDSKAALHYGRRLAELWPDRYAFNVAVVALRQNRPREALDLLRRAEPEHGFVGGWGSYWTTLNLAEHELGLHQQELVDAERARPLIPDVDFWVAFKLRALAALGRTDEAMALAGGLDTLPGGSLNSWWPMLDWLTLANELNAHGQPAAAREAANRGVAWAKLRPAAEQEVSENRRMLCDLLYAGGEWDEARRACAAVVAKLNDDPDALMHLASLAARRGDRRAAERFAVRLGRAKLIGWDGIVFAPSPAAAAAQLAQLARAHVAALGGHRDEAIRLLQAEADRWILWDPLLNLLDFDPDFTSLRGYPPFEALRRPAG